MPISETGHAKNVANFENLNSIVQSFGAAYNPPRTNLKLPALQTLQTNARNAIIEINNQMAEQAARSNERETVFEGLSRLATRIVNAVEVSDAEPFIGDQARTLVRKIRGERAGAPAEDDPATPDIDESENTHSVSQRSYDNQLANFDALVTLLESQPTDYVPNEPPLQTANLRARVNHMRAVNDAAKSAQAAIDAARATRDNVLYNESTGLVAIALDIKKYVKSAFGTTSPQYAQIKDLKFTTPR